MLSIIAFLLLILVLAYGPARRMLIDSLDYVVAFLVLLLTVCGFLFLGYLGWKFLARHLAIPAKIKIPLHFNFIKNARNLQIIYPAAILSITMFILLIILLKQRIRRWREKTNNFNSLQKTTRKFN
jgi:TRAP-type C4-dicarboxylate transport system permease small subunit